jgi:preprotein translocase subunit SecD
MRLGRSLFLIFAIFIVSVVYIVPWTALGVSLPISSQPYRLGLDLHGGVELDYKVETENIKASTGITAEASKKSIIEGVKAIIEKRVNSLGLAEPTIQTASYG